MLFFQFLILFMFESLFPGSNNLKKCNNLIFQVQIFFSSLKSYCFTVLNHILAGSDLICCVGGWRWITLMCRLENEIPHIAPPELVSFPKGCILSGRLRCLIMRERLVLKCNEFISGNMTLPENPAVSEKNNNNNNNQCFCPQKHNDDF